MQNSEFDLTLVIACYNDGMILEEHLAEIEATLGQTRYTYEFILIDDASPDGSARAVEEAAARRPHACGLLHERNVGRGGTVTEGMKRARGKYVGYLDIDLEVHCRYIPSMLLALDQGYDGATAFRVYRIQMNPNFLFRHLLSMGYRFLVHRLLRLPYRDTETGYKFFRREKIAPLLEKVTSRGWFWDTEIMALSWYHQLQVIEIPALFTRRNAKTSTVKPLRDSWNYMRELIRFRQRIRREGYL